MSHLITGARAPKSVSPDPWGGPIFGNSPVGTAVAELHGRFLMANPAYRRITGYSEGELRELTPLDLTAEAGQPTIMGLK